MEKRFIYLFIITCFFFLTGFSHAPAPETEKLYLVRKVIDGDTIMLENKDIIRYIGIDTPETVHPKMLVQHFGKEASQANADLVGAKKVKLEFDVQKKDQYNRILAYVYVDDIFVNAWLVENGYARVATYPPNVKYQDLFLKLEKEARENNRGLWGNNAKPD